MERKADWQEVAEVPEVEPKLEGRLESEEDLKRRRTEFTEGLTSLINRVSLDSELGVPDFVLADYLNRQVDLLKSTNTRTRYWKSSR